MYFCEFYKERWFDTKSGRRQPNKCADCEKHRNNNNIACRKFVAENDMGPFSQGYASNLTKCTKIKDMVVTRSMTFCDIYRLKNGSVSLNGRVSNIEQ